MFWNIVRRFLFLFDPEAAHHFAAFFLRCYGRLRRGEAPLFNPSSKKRQYKLGEIPLRSPLGLAAGFDKDAKMVLGIAALGFGFTEIGTVTPRPQPGNPRPRLVRLPHSRALLNRFGFNSEGADQVAARLRALRSRYAVQIPIGVNIGKNKTTSMNDAAKDYATAMEKLYAVSDYLVINVSSPNTPGLISLQEGENLPALLATVRDCRDRLASTVAGPKRPLFLKLSPDLLDKGLRDAVDCAMNAGFLGIIATNTSRRRNLEGISELDRPLLAQDGGLSGAPLRGEAYERIRKIRAWMGKSGCLISVGGLGDVADARARLELGADLLQVYSEFVYAGPAYPFQMGNAL